MIVIVPHPEFTSMKRDSFSQMGGLMSLMVCFCRRRYLSFPVKTEWTGLPQMGLDFIVFGMVMLLP